MAHNKKIFESLGYECINKMGTNDYPLNPMNTDEFNNYHILKKTNRSTFAPTTFAPTQPLLIPPTQ